MAIKGQIQTNRTSYAIAGIFLVALLFALLGYNAGKDSRQGQAPSVRVNVTSEAPKQAPSKAKGTEAEALAQEREQLERCKRYIVDNKDFPGYKSKECKGIQEDDYRLNVAYRAINPNGTGALCEQMYALEQADREHSYELTHLLQSYGMTEDVLVANFDVCEALGYTWAE